AGGARPGRGDGGRRACRVPGGRRRRRGAAAPGARPAAAGGGVRPGGAAPAVGGASAGPPPGGAPGLGPPGGGGAVKGQRLSAADVVLLKHHLAALRLPTVKAECEQMARQRATENIDDLGFLLRLCEQELGDRERRACARRLKAARFPQGESLDEF